MVGLEIVPANGKPFYKHLLVGLEIVPTNGKLFDKPQLMGLEIVPTNTVLQVSFRETWDYEKKGSRQ